MPARAAACLEARTLDAAISWFSVTFYSEGLHRERTVSTDSATRFWLKLRALYLAASQPTLQTLVRPGQEQYAHRLVAERDQLWGVDHPGSLPAREDLAGASWNTGRPDQAMPLLERNLADRERVLGPTIPIPCAPASTWAAVTGTLAAWPGNHIARTEPHRPRARTGYRPPGRRPNRRGDLVARAERRPVRAGARRRPPKTLHVRRNLDRAYQRRATQSKQPRPEA